MSNRKGSLLTLRDRNLAPNTAPSATTAPVGLNPSTAAPSRKGKKAITGFFSPEMSFSMHVAARKNGMTLQDAMADAFNDWLRKMGESPVGK
jgi:hypothetical protein